MKSDSYEYCLEYIKSVFFFYPILVVYDIHHNKKS